MSNITCEAAEGATQATQQFTIILHYIGDGLKSIWIQDEPA